MANIKSQIKRNRTNEERRMRNKSTRSALKTHAKGVYAAVDDGDVDGAQERLRDASRQIDKAASKGVIHKRTAARKKSRLARAAAEAAGVAEEGQE